MAKEYCGKKEKVAFYIAGTRVSAGFGLCFGFSEWGIPPGGEFNTSFFSAKLSNRCTAGLTFYLANRAEKSTSNLEDADK